MNANRPQPRFNYGDWVSPISIDNSIDAGVIWAWYEKDRAKSHIGNYIKITTRVWFPDNRIQPARGYWKYRASNAWYHEDDLISKEERQLSKKHNQTVFSNLPIADLL